MFNQFNAKRPFTPQTPQRPLPGQTPSSTPSGNQFSAQIRPDFLSSRPGANGHTTTGAQPANQLTSARMGRTQADSFSHLSPQSQRAALFDQARQQAAEQGRFIDPRQNLSGALPGGLTERQRMDFMSLQRTNPQAAEKQLLNYQRNADIRYNKPTGQTPPAGPTFRRPPTNFNGPRRTFGS